MGSKFLDEENDQELPYESGRFFNVAFHHLQKEVSSDKASSDNQDDTPSSPSSDIHYGFPDSDVQFSDPQQSNQWYLSDGWGINADQVWPDYTGQGINIGILDDGFDFNHSDLSNSFDPNASLHYDITNNNNNKQR